MMMLKAILSSQFVQLTLLHFAGEFHHIPDLAAPFLYCHFCILNESHSLPHANYHRRFVTGLVDTKIPGVRRTMFQSAVDLGLPASFVELRHEATHREPPSLVVLRKATQRSLEWLWDNYWAGIDDLGDIPRSEHDSDTPIKSALGDILRDFSAGSGSSQPIAKKRKRDQEISVAIHVVSICSAASEGVRVLPGILLEESLLVTSKRQ